MTTVKTLEFKLSLTRSQQQIIDQWLSVQKYVWNKGMELIKGFNEFNCYDKRFKASAPCCPIVTYDPKNRAVFPSCPIGWKLDDYSGFSCDFNEDGGYELTQTLLDEGKEIKGLVSQKQPFGVYPVRSCYQGKLVVNLTEYGLQPVFAHKRNQDKPWLTDVCSKFIDATVGSLALAWQAFLAGTRKPPKFKKKNERINTLIHKNTFPNAKTGRTVIPIEGDRIKIPRIGWVRVKGLSKRWPTGLPFCPLKICRKASAYYLQLSGTFEEKPLKPAKVKSVGLDPGIRFVYSDDAGKQIKVPPYLERDLQKLKELQRKAQKQWDMNHGTQTSQQPGWHPPMIDVPWSQRNWRKTQDKIAAIHEKIARRGRAFNHYQSTRLVRQFDQIFLEDYRVSEVVGKVDPIDSGRLVVNVNDELTTIYEKNGRKLNRDTNRAALRNRVGQLWTMIETKGGKKVVRVERAGTSNECPNCGHIKEKTLKVRTHRCEVCGFVAPRDVAAALVIKKRGLAGTHSCQKSEPKQKRQKRGRKKDSDEMSA